jgi:hypothetical protein
LSADSPAPVILAIFVRQVVRVLEDDRLALLHRQRRQGVLELGPHAARSALDCHQIQLPQIDVEEHRLATARPGQHGAALVDEDARQPGREPLLILIVLERAERTQERVLHRLLGVLPVSQDAERDTRAAGVMAVDEARVRLGVPRENLLDDCAIAHVYHATPIN